MKVYLVFGVIDYEGSDLLGVYDSLEKAEAAAKTAKVTPIYEGLPPLNYDQILIREKEVQ